MAADQRPSRPKSRLRVSASLPDVSRSRAGPGVGGQHAALGLPGSKYQPTLQVWRYEKGMWQPRTEAEFYAEDSADLVTPFYIHGNRIDPRTGEQRRPERLFSAGGQARRRAAGAVRDLVVAQRRRSKGRCKTSARRRPGRTIEAYYLARFLAE